MGRFVTTEDLDQGIVRLTMSDPSTRNAMSEEMGQEFESECLQLKQRSDMRVLIVTGAGKAFSGGGHLDMLFSKVNIDVEENRQLMEVFYRQFLSIAEVPVPVIAAINGHAVGAGLCLALACDIRVASTEAKFGLNFVQLGLHPGMGVTYFLPRIVGAGRAAELLFRGQILTAEEAHAQGLVNHLVSSAALWELVQSIAGDISRAGPQAVRSLKQSLRQSLRNSLAECLHREAACQAIDYCGPEFLEGISAAREKRTPKF